MFHANFASIVKNVQKQNQEFHYMVQANTLRSNEFKSLYSLFAKQGMELSKSQYSLFEDIAS